MGSDPFAVLGLTWQATLDEVRIARRTLAMELHPDKGGDIVRMQEVNVAFEAAVGHLTGREPLPTPAPPDPARAAGGVIRRRTVAAAAGPGGLAADLPRPPRPARLARRSPSTRCPAEAFEALLVVASWIGEVANDEPPYLLEAALGGAAPCWCRLDIVPDAGASTVSITVVFDCPADGVADAETVRDIWVANLNRLGRQVSAPAGATRASAGTLTHVVGGRRGGSAR